MRNRNRNSYRDNNYNKSNKRKEFTKKRWILWILLLLVAALGFSAYFLIDKFLPSKKAEGSTGRFDGSSQPANPNLDNPPQSGEYKKVGDLRLMSWNVLNFGQRYQTTSNKFMNIVRTIQISNADIVGLSEINYDDTTIVNRLQNALGSSWSYTFSGTNFNENYPRSRESVLILYKNKVVEPVSYSAINPDNIYTRPLWYTKFRTLYYGYSFITFFGHFDAPGANTNNGETQADGYSQQGSQEIKESKAIATVFKDLKQQYPDVDIIGAADTNIKEANNSVFTSNEYSLNYIDFNDNKTYYRTTLSEKNGYANSYDKWFVYDANQHNILKESDIPYKIDIINAFKNKIWDRNKSLAAWLASPNGTRYPNPTDFQLIKDVSDHAPIILDINFKPDTSKADPAPEQQDPSSEPATKPETNN
ncbi:MnuA family membrane nuclease [[Mycoplasma] imitans]|uniref:MnuA family membrane nuclease n=1 Tax=[Mycoplasma] imitans TaxID=29560 RepID=UPI001FE12DF4|nr:endonuclease/exonuclease/phosphatase family protein [[Mycoplasma] imitans]